jgi:peptidoglycan hydrolase CwlO-like protein
MNWENIIIALISGVFGAGLAFVMGLLKLGPENLLQRSKAKKYTAEAEQTTGETWQQIVLELRLDLDRQRNRIEALEKAIQEKDSLIDVQDAKIAAQGQEICELREAVEARDTQIAALTEKVRVLENKRGRSTANG